MIHIFYSVFLFKKHKMFKLKQQRRSLPKLVVLLGCAGTGRGTHLEKLCERFHYVPVSPSLLLNESKSNPAYRHHRLIVSNLQKKEPIPGSIICDLILDYVGEKSIRKFILDDFPNCEEQLGSFLELLVPRVEMVKVISLHCPWTICVQKVIGHQPETEQEHELSRKLSCYWKNVEPVLEYCRERGVVWQVDAFRSWEEVFEDLILGFSSFTLYCN